MPGRTAAALRVSVVVSGLAIGLAGDAGATVFIGSSSGYCDQASNCQGSPQVTGRDATSQYSRFLPQVPGDWLVDASFTVDFDFFGGYARASGQGTVESPGSVGFTARGGGIVFDLLTVGSGGGAGTLRLTWHLLGTAVVEDGGASFGIGCGAVPPGLPCTAGAVTTTGDQLYDQPLVLDLAVVLGTPAQIQLSVAASAGVGATSVGPPFPFTVSADGTWEARLVAVEVLDAAGQPIPGAPIVSESGFDWAAVPEPGAAPGAAAALLALAGCAARRRRSGVRVRTMASMASCPTSAGSPRQAEGRLRAGGAPGPGPRDARSPWSR